MRAGLEPSTRQFKNSGESLLHTLNETEICKHEIIYNLQADMMTPTPEHLDSGEEDLG
jgi:hypothetical protein